MKKIDVYTDGACSGNPGIGGWAAILLYNGHVKKISGYDKYTTNNRMELFAVIQALRCLKEPCEVVIYTDSAYVSDAFIKDWITNWQKANWKTSDKQPVKNQELWNALLFEIKKHKFQFVRVKGHSDCEYNNECDKMAVEEVEAYKKIIQKDA